MHTRNKNVACTLLSLTKMISPSFGKSIMLILVKWSQRLVLKFGSYQAGLAQHGPGQARAFLNGLRPSTNKSRAMLCPPDGLVAKPRHGTSPVNRVVPGRAANVPHQKTVQNSSKFHFFQNFTICNQIHQKIIMFILNSLHSGHSEIIICNQIHIVITNQDSGIRNM
jgi:hypothetical protein